MEEWYKEKKIATFANLATATAADRATVASLTKTINVLTLELKNTQAKLVAVLEQNKTL